MATTKEPWPLLYGGWKSYREWADHGFVPKETGRRHGRHESSGRPETADEPGESNDQGNPAAGGSAARTPVYVKQAGPIGAAPPPPVPEAPPPSPLRPYVMTSGRTRTRRELAIHALVSTTGHGHAAANRQLPEQRAICLLCRRPHSVAEVAAALNVPLGVARVLIDDMSHQGLVVVHGLENGGTSLEILGRVLDGLRRL